MNIFKYSNIKEFFSHLKKNYEVTSLRDWDNGNQIILRFDVDLDISYAYQMAQLLKEVGVPATFFIMTSCPLYNPLSKRNQEKLRKMSEDGFEIGLHFDPTVYPNIGPGELQVRVDMEASVLESITKKKVESVSTHNPSVHGKYPLFSGYKNAYASEIFGEDRYLSDSWQHLHHDPYEFIKGVRNHPVQIALHPFHYSVNGEGYRELFIGFAKKFLDGVDEEFMTNSDNREYIRHLGPGISEHFCGNQNKK